MLEGWFSSSTSHPFGGKVETLLFFYAYSLLTLHKNSCELGTRSSQRSKVVTNALHCPFILLYFLPTLSCVVILLLHFGVVILISKPLIWGNVGSPKLVCCLLIYFFAIACLWVVACLFPQNRVAIDAPLMHYFGGSICTPHSLLFAFIFVLSFGIYDLFPLHGRVFEWEHESSQKSKVVIDASLSHSFCHSFTIHSHVFLFAYVSLGCLSSHPSHSSKGKVEIPINWKHILFLIRYLYLIQTWLGPLKYYIKWLNVVHLIFNRHSIFILYFNITMMYVNIPLWCMLISPFYLRYDKGVYVNDLSYSITNLNI